MRFQAFNLFAIIVLFSLSSCREETDLLTGEPPVSQAVIHQIAALGFNPDGVERTDEGYRIEGDIIITNELLQTAPPINHLPRAEQYSTTNLVNPHGQRVLKVYMKVGDRGGFSSLNSEALNEAIERYNDEPLSLTFIRSSDAASSDIVINHLSDYDVSRGILASAGFPDAAGDPYPEIKLNGKLNPNYGYNQQVIASIIAHEIGHCIGFRHTDYYNRSISCGGAIYHEGNGTVGANHIPGTPTDATLAAASWMLSCTNGTNRPFNADDKAALFELYGLRVAETGY